MMTRKAIIYGKSSCSYCRKAKELMDSRGIKYEDRAIGLRYTADDVRKHCTKLKPGVEISTIPQIIFVGDDGSESYIGGHSDLVEFISNNNL